MKSTKTICWLLLLLLLALLVNSADASGMGSLDGKKQDDDDTVKTTNDGNSRENNDDKAAEENSSISSDSTENDLLEINPDYEEPDDEDDDDDDDDEDDEEEEDDVGLTVGGYDLSTVKSTIDKALSLSKKGYKKYGKRIKKNRSRIMLGLTVFAFRKEIGKFVKHLITKELVNKDGKLRISLTLALKLILFVNFMRRLQKGEVSNLNALVESNPVLASLFGRFCQIPLFNPAYIPPIHQHYTFERLNEKYLKDGLALQKALLSKVSGFRWTNGDGPLVALKNVSSGNTTTNVLAPDDDAPTVIVLDLVLDTSSPTLLEDLRDQVAFLTGPYREAAVSGSVEVVLRLESPGGSVSDFGLAAQQLKLLRDNENITLTVCVDKIAASGGYMMACVASSGQLFAAPFAFVGSIGVLGQIVNVQQLLEGYGVTPIVFRGGKDKAPLGLLGDVTREGKDKIQSMIDDTHKAFKKHVLDARPVLQATMKQVGTGDVWLGQDALELGLVDAVLTSDEYLQQKVVEGARVLKLIKHQRPRFLFSSAYGTPYTMGSSLRSLVHRGTAFLGSVMAGEQYQPILGKHLVLSSTTHQTPKAHI